MENDSETSNLSFHDRSSTGYDSDGFSCESETDFDKSSCDIATNPVTQVPDLGKLTRTPWSQVTKS